MNYLYRLEDMIDLYLPFSLFSHEKQYLGSLDDSYLNSKKQHLFIPLSDRCTIITLIFLLKRLQLRNDSIEFLYLVQTKKRKQFVYKMGKYLLQRNVKSEIPWDDQNQQKQQKQQVCISTDITDLHKKRKILIVGTVQQFARQQFYKDNTGSAGFLYLQTTHIVNTLSTLVEDYLTDTYVRRAYIQIWKIQQQYKSYQKTLTRKNSQEIVQPKKFQLINLVSKQSENGEQHSSLNSQNKGIYCAYQQKKQQLRNRKRTQNQSAKYLKNQLILLSLMMYILGFLHNIMTPKKQKSLKQFIAEFDNKTLLDSSLLEQMPKFLKRIMKNCPKQDLYNLQDMYLYQICQFLRKIQVIRNLYPNLQDKAVIIKYQKVGLQRNDLVQQQSVNSLRLCLVQPKKILTILQDKVRNYVFVQNLTAPKSYISSIFGNKLSIKQPKYSMNNLFGVQISKTSSNQDMQFTKTSKNSNLTIKMKACGVMLYQLTQFVPDGVVVYFYSTEGLSIFLSLLNKQEQKILKKINTTKKIFIESQFESENIKNFQQFQKCCNIGRGAIFLMSANSNMAITQQFYRHYSNCIVFIGLPKDIKERDQEESEKQQNQIPILLRCLNNCVNQLSEAKGVLFVGRQINNGLDKWLSFVKLWDETTRAPLPLLRAHYKNNQKIRKNLQKTLC